MITDVFSDAVSRNFRANQLTGEIPSSIGNLITTIVSGRTIIRILLQMILTSFLILFQEI
jgi:predicted Abi (CAAX) family protease